PQRQLPRAPSPGHCLVPLGSAKTSLALRSDERRARVRALRLHSDRHRDRHVADPPAQPLSRAPTPPLAATSLRPLRPDEPPDRRNGPAEPSAPRQRPLARRSALSVMCARGRGGVLARATRRSATPPMAP